MTLTNKSTNKYTVAALSTIALLLISIALSWFTLYLAESTSAASGDMITFTYAIGTLGVGLLTLLSYGGIAGLIGYIVISLNFGE